MNKINLAKFVNNTFNLWKNDCLTISSIEEEKKQLSAIIDDDYREYYDLYNLCNFFKFVTYVSINDLLKAFLIYLENIDHKSYTYAQTYINGLDNQIRYYQTIEILNHIHYLLKTYYFKRMDNLDSLESSLFHNNYDASTVFFLENYKTICKQNSLFPLITKKNQLELSKLQYDLKNNVLNALINDILFYVDSSSFYQFKRIFISLLNKANLPQDIKVMHLDNFNYLYKLIEKRLSMKKTKRLILGENS